MSRGPALHKSHDDSKIRAKLRFDDLCQKLGGYREVGRRLGVDESTVRHWADRRVDGARLPLRRFTLNLRAPLNAGAL